MGDWRKSTYSDGTGGNCVETASHIGNGMIVVRDTANREDGMLVFAADAWKAFTAGLKFAA